ncbi:hypothetical protein GCM10010915_08690 [Microbacterium faecale]|uniref:DUF1345 domain-containing protein n=1 Tax=Microbacterium faecale TaxID=1804630 RepID=A0A916Y485_9MICO|nr:DUF1345 domain-containing protein [Microbacterium faecale]GGD30653.1 hypothetical protein GCM10010915_08690 [Microbacterium faecale]
MKTTDRVALAVAALAPFAAFALGAASRQRGRQRPQPRTVPPSPEPEDPRAPRWLASPSRRNWLATFASMLPLAAFIWVIVSDPAQRAEEWSLPVVMVFWGTFALVHSGLTVAALWGLEGARLHRSIVLVKRRDFGMTSSARALAVQTPLVVLVIVAVIVLTPAFRGDRYLVALTLAFVVIAWINTALLFAENYIAQGSRGLAFPGEGRIGFADYVYFSLAVQMTFGTSDVSITDRATRRNVTIHATTAFAFNTIIIAMIVSLLVTG